MKSDPKIRLHLLQKVENADEPLLFEGYYVHGIGGHVECRTPDWTAHEAYEIKQLALRGYLNIEQTKGDEPWLCDGSSGENFKETYLYLSPAGHDRLEDERWQRKLAKWFKSGLGSVVTSIVFPAMVAWMTSAYFEQPKSAERSTPSEATK